MTKDKQSDATLVIGIDSLIGSAIAGRLRQYGSDVWGTTRRRETVSAQVGFLDLATGIEDPGMLKNVDRAVFCAGITDQHECEQRPNKTRDINVLGARKLLDDLQIAGVRTVFLSSNLVLSCASPQQTELSNYQPQGEYGAQKAEVEKFMMADMAHRAIVRLSKVMSPELPLIVNWKVDMSRGEKIQAFSDLALSPISIEYSVSSIIKVLHGVSEDLFHIAGAGEITYCDLAKKLANGLGHDCGMIDCIDSAETSVQLVAKPIHPSLSGEKLKEQFGIEPEPLDDVVARLCAATDRKK